MERKKDYMIKREGRKGKTIRCRKLCIYIRTFKKKNNNNNNKKKPPPCLILGRMSFWFVSFIHFPNI